MSDGKEEEPEEIILANLNKTVFLSVSGIYIDKSTFI